MKKITIWNKKGVKRREKEYARNKKKKKDLIWGINDENDIPKYKAA